ncbi:DHA2 family efflux MFS transporter permease subunit [Nostoc sp. UHCC 0252]|uniref:DHA2 family efflux MFS transporter permease subunit n=1 Tax=Nostoc sp. UHCC 0252 TaxID=3110241 RepID=UPI002B21DDB1|nr:DHA2 family efflux MFS transporter permease subunit [Nostoc sp. UHCC 0252]MEA5602795.1 DHA2 family efflux MFS transporter permease subunit [Nostoc sp. UHCC 0252]
MKPKYPLESQTGKFTITPPPINKWLITTTLMLGTLIAIIDTSIVNVAIPQIQSNLGGSIDEISSVVTFYIISNVIVMPLTGYLSALWGRKQFYAGAIILFTIASLLCGLSWNLSALVFFRILQGLGAGVLFPTAQAILLDTFPREEHGKAMSIFGLGMLVAPALGPVLGGYLADTLTWRSIFLINVPIGLIAAVMVFRFIHDSPYLKKPQGKFDWSGLIALVIGLSSLQYVLENGQRLNWFDSTLIIVLLIVGVSAIAYLVWWELVNPSPIMDLSLFRNRTFALGNIITFLAGFSLFGVLFISPVFLSQVLKYDSLTIGMLLMPGPVATALIMPLTGVLANRLDARMLLAIGIAFSAGGTWQLSDLNLQSDYWDIFWPQVWRGIGLGLLFVPLSLTTLGYVSKAKRTSASGLYNLINQLGGSIGIAGLALMLGRLQAFHSTNLAPIIKQSEIVQQQAAVLAYNDLFRYSTLIILASYLPLLFLKVRLKTRKKAPIILG